MMHITNVTKAWINATFHLKLSKNQSNELYFGKEGLMKWVTDGFFHWGETKRSPFIIRYQKTISRVSFKSVSRRCDTLLVSFIRRIIDDWLRRHHGGPAIDSVNPECLTSKEGRPNFFSQRRADTQEYIWPARIRKVRPEIRSLVKIERGKAKNWAESESRVSLTRKGGGGGGGGARRKVSNWKMCPGGFSSRLLSGPHFNLTTWAGFASIIAGPSNASGKERKRKRERKNLASGTERSLAALSLVHTLTCVRARGGG